MFSVEKMESFATFNFDILAIIVFITGLLFGSYYGFARQLKKTINLTLPFFILHFSLEHVVRFLLKINFIRQSKEKIFLWLEKHFVIAKYENVIFCIFVGIILYLLIYLLIYLILKLFSPSKEKIILKKTSVLSRVLGAVSSVMNTYIYLTLLLFVLGTTMISSISKPLANVITKTSTKVFDISLLNQYQNNNVQKYRTWTHAFEELNGSKALAGYRELDSLANEFAELNTYFSNEMIPNLSPASQTRIENAKIDDDYVLTLMEMGEKRTLFYYVLLDEKENSLYDVFFEKYEYLLAKRGYVYFIGEVLENDFSSYTFDEIFELLENNKTKILDYFVKESDRANFLAVYNSMSFYFNNHNELYRLTKKTLYDYPINEYVDTFNQLFQNPSSIDDFVEEYLKEYINMNLLEKSEYEQRVFKTLKEAFSVHSKYKEEIFLIDSKNSYPVRLILGQSYRDFFQNHSWEEEILLSSYFCDTLSSQELSGHDLYFEYFAFEYVLKTNEEVVTIKDIKNGLNRIKDLSNLGIITDKARYSVLEKIFTKDTGFLFNLLDKNLLAENLIDDILNSTDIDSAIKVYLTN